MIPIHFNGLPENRSSAKNSLKSASPRAAPVPIFQVLMRFWLPCGLAASHTPWISPYVSAAPPCGHTPDASPHTPRQIPIARPSPHTIYNHFKTGFSFDETSGSSSTNPQPTLPSKHPEPASQLTQTKRRPAPANPTDLRGGGCRHLLHARPWSCMHGHCHSHARPCSYLYGLCARPRQRLGTLLPRPASGLSRSTRPTGLLKCPEPASHLRKSSANPTHSNPLGGMGMASLRDAAPTSQWGPAFKPARRPAPTAQGVDPRGIWTGWIQQKSADAAPDPQDE